MLNQKWELQKIRTDAQTLLLCTVFETVVSSFFDLAEAQLAHSGTLGTHNKFHEAEMIWCRTLVLAASTKAKYSGQGRG